VNAFHQRSDWRGVAAVAGEYLAAGGAVWAALTWPSWWSYALAVLVIGTRQYALAEALTHEAAHGNLCASRRLNDALGRLTTWPFFYVLSGYRRYHLEHHRVPLDDPENNIYEQYADWGLPDPAARLSRARAVWLFVGRPLLGVMAVHHGRTLLSNVRWDRDLVETWCMLGAWALACAAAWKLGLLEAVLLLWVVPQLLVVGTLDFWSETADHYRVRGADTRSTLGPFLNRFVSHNIGYHALHHRYPGIPWFNLPRAYAALRPQLREQASTGYLQALRQITETDSGPAAVRGIA